MTRKDDAYTYIRDQIITNQLKPNDVISENQLTSQLQMSRTPVREAIKQLVSDGLVVLNGRENVVAPLTENDVQEIYELRSLLEQYALKKTINIIPEARLDNIQRDFQKAYQEKDWNQYLAVDTKFHELITQLSGHQRLKQFLTILKARTARTRHISATNDQRMASSYQEHLQIIKWIRQRNINEAEKALAYHLEKVYKSASTSLNYL